MIRSLPRALKPRAGGQHTRRDGERDNGKYEKRQTILPVPPCYPHTCAGQVDHLQKTKKMQREAVCTLAGLQAAAHTHVLQHAV